MEKNLLFELMNAEWDPANEWIISSQGAERRLEASSLLLQTQVELEFKKCFKKDINMIYSCVIRVGVSVSCIRSI